MAARARGSPPYRLCLRTFSAQESHAVLGTAAAFALPPQPGLGFLAVDGDAARFTVALMTPPHDRTRTAPADDSGLVAARPFTLATRASAAVTGEGPGVPAVDPGSTDDPTTDMEAVIGRLLAGARQAGHGRAHQVWLPPLPSALSLDRVLGAE